ncbi:MAG: nitrilase-related carbon-nitrogen hydrolase [Rubrivivax sp.]
MVREVLDTHYAMSHDAVQRRQAQALLWSETVYPTTSGGRRAKPAPKLDREIAAIVNAAGVPLVFGTYEGAARDPAAAGSNAAAEYNAAAFLAPGRGLVGFYRKTRLFPFTEALPAWLETPWLRNALPWAGAWKAGDGARVLPLLLADGREVPVLPLICLDDVDTQLAIDGARLGARLIVTMSNDSWFTEHAQGAELHLAVAAFRSIETRLPQFRVTSNGYSAVIDARGEVLAGTRMGERTLVVGDLPAREPRRTLMVMWGDWVGRAGAVFLLALMMVAAFQAWRSRAGKADAAANAAASATPSASAAPMAVAVLTPAARWTAALLRVFAYGGLAWPNGEGVGGRWRTGVEYVGAAARLSRPSCSRRKQRRSPCCGPAARRCRCKAACSRWRAASGASIGRARRGRGAGLGAAAAGARRDADAAFGRGLVVLARACRCGGAASGARGGRGRGPGTAMPSPSPSPSPAWAARYGQAFLAPRGSAAPHHRLTRFVLLPFLLAIPAFTLPAHRLRQRFRRSAPLRLRGLRPGPCDVVGGRSIGIVAAAAALRGLIEAGTLAAVLWRPARVLAVRRALERLGLAALYLGVPGWLALRMLAG